VNSSRATLVLLTALLLGACSGGSGSKGGGALPAPVSGQIVAALVDGASVKLFSIINGQKGVLLGEARSGSDGGYALSPSNDPSYDGPVLLEATGGTIHRRG